MILNQFNLKNIFFDILFNKNILNGRHINPISVDPLGVIYQGKRLRTTNDENRRYNFRNFY